MGRLSLVASPPSSEEDGPTAWTTDPPASCPRAILGFGATTYSQSRPVAWGWGWGWGWGWAGRGEEMTRMAGKQDDFRDGSLFPWIIYLYTSVIVW